MESKTQLGARSNSCYKCSTTPWDGRITVGVLNVTDEDPELDSFASPRPAVYSLYSLDGRIPYVSYRHFF